MSVSVYDTSLSSGICFFCAFCMLGTLMLLLLCCLFEKILIVNLVSLIGKNSLQILCFHAVIYQYIDVINDELNLFQYSWYVTLKILTTMTISIYLGKFICAIENKFKFINNRKIGLRRD